MPRISIRRRSPGRQAPRRGTRDQAQPPSARDGEGLEVYGDSVYGSREARAAYRDAGHDTIIKPGPVRPAVPGGFTQDDFTVDEDHGTVTCPAGQVLQMSKTRTVTFGAARAACPLRERCTTAKDGRSMTIHSHDELLRAARAQARTAEFKQACPTRSAIERIISWTATQNGRRVRLRFLGTAKNDAWLHNRCAAINLHLATARADPPGRGLDAGLTGQHPAPGPAATACAAPGRADRTTATGHPSGRRAIPGAKAGSADHKAIHRIRVIQSRPRTRSAHRCSCLRRPWPR
jgi:Transposase DDE domain